MAKYSVDKIKIEAIITKENYKGQKGDRPAGKFSVHHIRVYIHKVLFLCKEIERLTKKLEKTKQA